MLNPSFERDRDRLILRTTRDSGALIIGGCWLGILCLMIPSLLFATPNANLFAILAGGVVFAAAGVLMMLPHETRTTFDLVARRVDVDFTLGSNLYRSHESIPFSEIVQIESEDGSETPGYSFNLRTRGGGILKLSVWAIDHDSFVNFRDVISPRILAETGIPFKARPAENAPGAVGKRKVG